MPKVVSERDKYALVISVGILLGMFSIFCPGIIVTRLIEVAGTGLVRGCRFAQFSKYGLRS